MYVFSWLTNMRKLKYAKVYRKKGAWTYCGHAAGDSNLNLGEMLAAGQ